MSKRVLFSLLFAFVGFAQWGCQSPTSLLQSVSSPVCAGGGLCGLAGHASSCPVAVGNTVGGGRISVYDSIDGGRERTIVRESPEGRVVRIRVRQPRRTVAPTDRIQLGTVVESMVYDTRGESLVRVSRNGGVKVVSSANRRESIGMTRILDVPSEKLESIVILLDDGQTKFVVQEIQRRLFESGDRVRLVSDRSMRVYHL